jgi:hypothetical protein
LAVALTGDLAQLLDYFRDEGGRERAKRRHGTERPRIALLEAFAQRRRRLFE